MSEARLQCTPVFNWNYSADNRFVINQGGTWSSKTYSVLQALLLKLINGPGNEVCTVTADTFPALRLGAIRDFDSILAASGLASIVKAANFRYTLFNGSIIEFRAFTSDYDARNGKRQYLFINEANNVEHEIARQLIMRTSKQVYIDFNPSAEFWAHKTIQQTKGQSGFIQHTGKIHSAPVKSLMRSRVTSIQRRSFTGSSGLGNVGTSPGKCLET